ncbi:MAG: hypothetical protein JWP20_1725, partial [Roseomonas sp.]|nr:hypothetical protein [Roseomonas sp.]
MEIEIHGGPFAPGTWTLSNGKLTRGGQHKVE